MTSATHLAYETEHRWFTLSAKGEKSDSLTILLTLAENEEYVELPGVALKDTLGNRVWSVFVELTAIFTLGHDVPARESEEPRAKPRT